MKIKIEDKVYDVEILESESGVKIKVGGNEFFFGSKEEEKISAPHQDWRGVVPKRDFAEKEIKAPLSGIVSEVFVKEGDFIKPGQKLLLLSAMKMENEIVSDFEGKVKKIFVEKNQKVKESDNLIIIE